MGAALGGLQVAVFFDHHVVANGGKGLFHLLGRDAVGIVFHQGRSVGQVDAGRGDAFQGVQFSLDTSGTAGTHHAQDGHGFLLVHCFLGDWVNL